MRSAADQNQCFNCFEHARGETILSMGTNIGELPKKNEKIKNHTRNVSQTKVASTSSCCRSAYASVQRMSFANTQVTEQISLVHLVGSRARCKFIYVNSIWLRLNWIGQIFEPHFSSLV